MQVRDFRLGPAVARGIVTVADATVDGGDLLTVSGGNTVLGFSVSGVNVSSSTSSGDCSCSTCERARHNVELPRRVA